jgi:hypothetical protein
MERSLGADDGTRNDSWQAAVQISMKAVMVLAATALLAACGGTDSASPSSTAVPLS